MRSRNDLKKWTDAWLSVSDWSTVTGSGIWLVAHLVLVGVALAGSARRFPRALFGNGVDVVISSGSGVAVLIPQLQRLQGALTRKWLGRLRPLLLPLLWQGTLGNVGRWWELRRETLERLERNMVNSSQRMQHIISLTAFINILIVLFFKFDLFSFHLNFSLSNFMFSCHFIYL